MYSLNIFNLFLNSSGTAAITLNSKPSFLSNAASLSGDSVPRFPAYVSLANLGGDADFYGPQKNKIFPMEVKTPEAKKAMVEQTELGLEDQAAQHSWDSWRNLSNLHGQVFNKTIWSLVEKNVFPENVAQIIKEVGKDGQILGLWMFFSYYFRQDSSKNMLSHEEIIQATQTIGTEMSQINEPEGFPDILEAAGEHASNLQEMYATASQFRADVYHY